MGFSTLSLYQFRNLSDTTYTFSSREVFLIGENGQGKTNTLEALYLLCYASSFRAHHDGHLIKDHGSEAQVKGEYLSDDGSMTDISVILHNPGNKEITTNG